MRKYIINQSRFATQPTSEATPRKWTLTGKSPLNRNDCLGQFHQQLNFRSKMLISTRNETRSLRKPIIKKEQFDPKMMHKDLSKVGQQLQTMRREFTSVKNQIRQERSNQKLHKFIHLLESSIHQRKNGNFSFKPQQVVFPFILPYPITPNSSQKNDTFYQNEKPTMREKKSTRIKRNIRKLTKVWNCIIFIIFLRNYCKRIRQLRKADFNKLLPSLQNYLKQYSMDLNKILKPIYRILLLKRQVNLDFQQSESKQVTSGKVGSIRNLVLMVIQAAKKWVQLASKNKKWVEIAYHLCKHGNYSCTTPILTTDQLQLTSISIKHNFVSADRNLQNSAFINLFFMKILIYNGLLSPQTVVVSQFDDDIFRSNLCVIASVLYELAIILQDQYMLLVPKSYKIGNYNKIKGIAASSPLCYKNVLKTEGDLISGLKGQVWTQQYFDLQSWSKEKQQMRQTVNIFHSTMVKQHKNKSKICF